MYQEEESNIQRAMALLKASFKGKVKWVWIALALFIVLKSGWFIIKPTERGNVRRLGTVQYATPLKPGLHFKLPLIDTVDTLQVSLTTLHIPPFKVMTIDNQEVTLDLNFNFTIPDTQVNHLLYEVGGVGSVDLESSIVPVAKDRAARVIAVQNMVTVNANREEIQAKIAKGVFEGTKELFGIEPHSLQIAGIIPSQSFMESNEAAVRAKNKAVEAENMKKTRQFEADQKVIEAKGKADSAIETARGEAESTRLRAEAEKVKLTLEGEGAAAKALAEIRPFGSPEKYIQFLGAKAALNWDGRTPQIIAGGGAATPLVIPLPALANPEGR
jgi:modulator of FtsH protease HflC